MISKLTTWLLLSLVLVYAISLVSSVDRGNFKTCSQSGFCKRQRNYKPTITPYQVIFDTLSVENGHVRADMLNTKSSVTYVLDLFLLKDNRYRFKLNEKEPLRRRYEVEDVVIDSLEQEKLEIVRKTSYLIELKSPSNTRVILYANPFKLEFYIDEYLVSSFNSKNLLKFEHLRKKPEPKASAAENQEQAQEEEKNAENENKNPQENVEEEEEPDMWEETFKSHTDSKPNGPESVGLDVSFHDFQHVYGIPSHADSFALGSTVNGDPYRLYNLDVFEYEVGNQMALYASIPYMLAHNQKFTIGIFWLNAAETWVDVSSNISDKSLFSKVASFISKSNEIPQIDAHWMSESGIIDIYVLLGPKPADVFRQYGKLTGVTPLPPLFSIAYHQCRWNYNDETDVKTVNAGFDEHQIPMDVMWLDIEHTDGKRYFTWDSHKFPNPEEMMNHMSSYGRKMVTIVDPHIKIDTNFAVYSEAKDKNFFIKNKNGNEAADGWCWPGSSSWPDFLNEDVRNWWASKFKLDSYKGTTLDTYTWNDMNEPSVFNGPEITFNKDVIHLNGLEHRHVHNVYGFYNTKATHQGHLEKSNGERRPFVLTRSAFAGSQRYTSIWTGDNTAEWSHLKMSIPMLLSLSVTGMSFCGADVGGFFKNVEAELMVRWYQAAAYQPFFRSHAHIDTKRREPWLFGEANTNLIRDAIHARYTLLYYWYTLFYLNEKTGTPPMLPLWANFPNETNLFGVDDEFMVGPALLVKPITDQGATSVDVIFPGPNELWYDIKSMRVYNGGDGATKHTFTDINLSTIPVFQRGGYIVPYKFRLRRSSTQMADDPFTLAVTLDRDGKAHGELYFDDATSFNYQKRNEYVHREFQFVDGKLTSSNVVVPGVQKPHFETKAWLERVIIYGLKSEPKEVKIEFDDTKSSPLQFTFDSNNKVILIRKPGVNINKDWSIIIN